MKSPLVSVLMPAYNAERYISQSIESILNQSYKEFIFIILDDASTDGTLNIIKKYEKADNRIRVIQNKKNSYIAACRNTLILSAKTKYIAWQDADDISMPDRLKVQVDYMEHNPDVGIVGGYIEFFDEKGNKSLRTYEKEDRKIRKNVFKFSPVAQPTAMIRKECFDQIGLYNLKYPPAEDIDISFRIGTKYKFANLQQVLLKYRESESSATYKKLRKMELSTLEVRSKYFLHPAYSWTILDLIYNLLQFFSVYLIPTKLKIQIFKKIRNEKN